MQHENERTRAVKTARPVRRGLGIGLDAAMWGSSVKKTSVGSAFRRAADLVFRFAVSTDFRRWPGIRSATAVPILLTAADFRPEKVHPECDPSDDGTEQPGSRDRRYKLS